MMYSARCFRCFLRKSRVKRRDAMKSELFTTINGVFCRFCASAAKDSGYEKRLRRAFEHSSRGSTIALWHGAGDKII